MLCLAGNEEVVEATHRSEALCPHKHSHNSEINNRDERLSTLEALIFSAGLLKRGENGGNSRETSASSHRFHLLGRKVFCRSLTLSSDISSHLISSLTSSAVATLCRVKVVAADSRKSPTLIWRVNSPRFLLSKTFLKHTHQNLGLLFSL